MYYVVFFGVVFVIGIGDFLYGGDDVLVVVQIDVFFDDLGKVYGIGGFGFDYFGGDVVFDRFVMG